MSEFDSVTGGSELGVGDRWSATLVKVSRVTATQIILESGGRYNKRTGRRVGDGRDSHYSLITLDEAKRRIENERAAVRVRNIKEVVRAAKNAFRVQYSEIPALLRQIADDIEKPEPA